MASTIRGATDFTRELVADFVELPIDRIDPDADIFVDYGIESLQLVEMMTALERRSGGHLDFDDFRETRTVTQIGILVSDRAQEKHSRET